MITGAARAVLCVVAVAAALSGCDNVKTVASRAGLVPTFEQDCAKQLPPTKVIVTTAPLDYDVDVTRSYRDLTEMSPTAGYNDRALGLTLTQAGYKASIELAGIEEKRGGRVCMRPAIKVELAMTPMTVYVASEYHGDPCREPVILEHERKHVAVFSASLADLARDVRRVISDDFGNTIFYAKDSGELKHVVEERISVYLEPMIHEGMGTIKAKQREVDTPEEYARVAAACGGMKID